jgi:TonB-linked SusC/RagA family outer membrane protein
MNFNAIRINAMHFHVPRAILLVMKITTLLLLITIMTVSASSLAQKITLNEKKATLEQVLKKIRQQSGYDFVYSDDMLTNAEPVTINIKDATLNEALQASLKDQRLTFEIADGAVTFKVKEPNFIDKLKAIITNIDVTGRVLDEQGLPIPSATVTVRGTSNATITDASGYFSLKNIDDKAIIVISVIGYEKKEVAAKNNVGSIRLTIAESKLDEVHIIAYGQSSERLTIGNIGKVSAKEIEEQPVNNPLLALIGRIPGLFITQNTGLAGGGVTVRIQGQNSILQGNDPFYVIDGVPYIQQMINSTMIGSAMLGAQNSPGSSPMNYIDPSNIESIEILKDADATAIYGSRAANGAILITTKKGRVGESKVDMNVQQGYQFTPELAVLNTSQYLAVRREALRNDGLFPTANPTASSPNVYTPDLMFWDTTRTTNWQKALLGNSAKYTNINGTISGGTSNIQYLIGGTYNDQESVFPGDYTDKKGAVHFQVNTASLNQKFKIQLSGSYMADNNLLPSNDLTNTALTLPPDAPPLYNSDGTLNWALNSLGNNTWNNPLTYLYQRYQNKTNNLISNSVISYEIVPGLKLASTFGYNKLETNEYSYYLPDAVPPASRPTLTLAANYSNNTISTWLAEPQLTYRATIKKGVLNALLGTTFQRTNSDGLLYSGTGYTSPAVLADIKSATSVTINNSFNSVYNYNALFSRLNYTWDEKYIVDLTARRDGSSRFGPENQFHNFWSVGGGWIFSQEAVVVNNLPFLSFGKLKASYGKTGSDQINDYAYLSLYTPLSNGIAYQGASSTIISSTSGLSNPHLQWEETQKLQIGADLGFLKDRLLLNITYSKNRSSNELLAYNLPSITGFTSVTANFPATVENTSWEFAFNTVNIKSAYFVWTTNLNLTIPENKLVDFPNLATSTYASSLVIGQPIIGFFKRSHFLGVDPATGVYRFADRFGNPVSSPTAADQTLNFSTMPKFYGGFQNSIHFKNLELSFLFQFIKQKGLYNIGSTALGKVNNSPLSAISESHWQQPGDVSAFQRYTTNNSSILFGTLSYTGSDADIVDASYIRLKNLSLSYQLPEKLLRYTRLKNMRIFAQAQNLLTITSYPGQDPENQANLALPPLKTITLGLQLGL